MVPSLLSFVRKIVIRLCGYSNCLELNPDRQYVIEFSIGCRTSWENTEIPESWKYVLLFPNYSGFLMIIKSNKTTTFYRTPLHELFVIFIKAGRDPKIFIAKYTTYGHMRRLIDWLIISLLISFEEREGEWVWDRLPSWDGLGTNCAQGFPLAVKLNKAVTHLTVVRSEY